jgi:Ubiquinol-cytochrome C reductase, UQCRX/QCR9 like
MKRNSVYIVFILGGAILGERVSHAVPSHHWSSVAHGVSVQSPVTIRSWNSAWLVILGINMLAGSERRLQQGVGGEQQGGAHICMAAAFAGGDAVLYPHTTVY